MGCGASKPSKYAVPTGEPSPSRTMSRQVSNLSHRPALSSDEGFAAFISHVKAEASMEARFLQTELEGLAVVWMPRLGAGRLGPELRQALKRRASVAAPGLQRQPAARLL